MTALVYTREGMFGNNSALFERKTVGRMGGTGRMRLGCLTVAECGLASVTLTCALLAVMPAWFFAGRVGMLELGDRAFGNFYGYVEFVMSLFIFYGITLATGTLFVWNGEMSRYETWVFRTSVIMAFGLCYEKRPTDAAILASTNGLIAWYGGRVGKDRCWSLGPVVGALGLTFLVILNGVYLVAVPVVFFVVGRVLESGYGGRGTVDQVRVRVDNKSDALTVDKMFARLMVPLDYTGVPDSVMTVVTCAGGCSGTSVEFRRWAGVGDAALAAAVNVYGLENAATVADISRWKQNHLTRNAMSNSVCAMPAVKARFIMSNGVYCSSMAAEAFEAMVGASWYYEYSCGADKRWLAHLRDLMISRLGLPKPGKVM